MDTHKITYVHNILINKTFDTPALSILDKQRTSAEILYPEAEYCLWNGEECRDLIKTSFEKDVLESFDMLVPYAFKSDLARYCLLYKFGGIYNDLAIILQNRWEIPINYNIAAFNQRYDNMKLWLNTMQGLLWSSPGQREWEIAIRKIVQHCKIGFYGPHDHYVTGPALVGFSFAQAMLESEEKINQQFMGEVRFNITEGYHKTAYYITPTRTLVATRQGKKAGSLTELGIETGNHYPQLWRAKKVYGERNNRWDLNEAMFLVPEGVKKTEDGLQVPSTQSGLFCYGPYINLIKGKYRINIMLEVMSKLVNSIIVEIAYGEHHKVYKRVRKYIFLRKRKQKISIFFFLKEDYENVEFRIRGSKNFSGKIFTIELKNIG